MVSLSAALDNGGKIELCPGTVKKEEVEEIDYIVVANWLIKFFAICLIVLSTLQFGVFIGKLSEKNHDFF